MKIIDLENGKNFVKFDFINLGDKKVIGIILFNYYILLLVDGKSVDFVDGENSIFIIFNNEGKFEYLFKNCKIVYN